MILDENDQKVRKAIRAEKQKYANDARQHNLTDDVNEVTPGGRFVLGPALSETDPQRIKRQEAWWPPFALNRARGGGEPRLSDDAYRAAVEIKEYWNFLRFCGYRISNPEHVIRGVISTDETESLKIKYTDLKKKYRLWVEAAYREDYMNKRLRSGKKYYHAMHEMIIDEVPIKSMRKKHLAHDSTMEKILNVGLELYVTLHFQGKRK